MALLHAHRLEVDPGTFDDSDGPNPNNNNYSFCYPQWVSAGQILIRGNPGTVQWADGQYASSGEIWYAPTFKIGAGNTSPGRLINFHNHGDSAYGGWLDAAPVNGVSAVALDWKNGSSYSTIFGTVNGLLLTVESESSSHKWVIYTDAEMLAKQAAGDTIDLVFRIIIGRPGRIYIWKDGLDTPIDTGPVNTHWAGQSAYLMYGPGIYNSSGVSSTARVESTYARTGPTLAAMLADTNPTEAAVNGSVLKSNPSVPGFRHVSIGTWDTASFRIPAALGGAGTGGGGGGGTPAPDSDILPTVNRWFGNQTVGAVQAGLSADRRRGGAYKPSEPLLLDTLYASLGGAGLATEVEQIKGQVWLMDADPAQGGVPTTLLRETNQIQVTGTEPRSWRTLTLTSPLAVDSTKWYLLALHTGGTQAAYIASASAGGWFFSKVDTYTGGSDSTWGVSDGVDNRALAIFAAGIPTTAFSKRLVIPRTTLVARTVNPAGRVVGGSGGGL